MLNKKHYDIAIIGGGMVGASLALLLAKKNPAWQIALLEARAFPESKSDEMFQPSFDSRSTAIAHGSVELLQELGIWHSLSQQATPIKKVHVSDAGHFMGGLIDAITYGLDAVGYVIPNAWLGRVLLSAVREQNAIDCIAPVTVQRMIPKQKGTRLAVEENGIQQDVDCALAIVADGGDSPLRAQLGISTTVKAYNQTAVIANVSFTQPHNGIAYERFTPLGPLALLPLGKSSRARESALVLTLPSAQADDVIAMNDADFLQHLQTRFGYRLGTFERVGSRVAYPLQLVTADEQIRSHIALVGNAAHYLHPVAGQGFNLSLRDCNCLVDAIAKGESAGKTLGELSALQNYLHQQALDQKLTIEFSDKLVRLFSNDSLPLTALRHLGFLGLDLLPSVKSQFAAQTMGTATPHYV